MLRHLHAKLSIMCYMNPINKVQKEVRGGRKMLLSGLLGKTSQKTMSEYSLARVIG